MKATQLLTHDKGSKGHYRYIICGSGSQFMLAYHAAYISEIHMLTTRHRTGLWLFASQSCCFSFVHASMVPETKTIKSNHRFFPKFAVPSIKDHDKQPVLFNERLLPTAEPVSMFDSAVCRQKIFPLLPKSLLMLRFLSSQMWYLKDMNDQTYLWFAQLHMLLEQRPRPQTVTLPWHILKAYPLWGQVQCSPVSEEYWKGTCDHACVFYSVISTNKKTAAMPVNLP